MNLRYSHSEVPPTPHPTKKKSGPYSLKLDEYVVDSRVSVAGQQNRLPELPQDLHQCHNCWRFACKYEYMSRNCPSLEISINNLISCTKRFIFNLTTVLKYWSNVIRVCKLITSYTSLTVSFTALAVKLKTFLLIHPHTSHTHTTQKSYTLTTHTHAHARTHTHTHTHKACAHTHTCARVSLDQHKILWHQHLSSRKQPATYKIIFC